MGQVRMKSNDEGNEEENNVPRVMPPFIPFVDGKNIDKEDDQPIEFSKSVTQNNQTILRWNIASKKMPDSISAYAIVPRSCNDVTELPHQPAIWACWAGRTALEIMSGAKSTNVMQRWAQSSVLRSLRQKAPKHKAVGERPPCEVRAVRLFEYSTRTYEAAVTVFDGIRLRAVGMRLENLRGRWSVTSLQVA